MYAADGSLRPSLSLADLTSGSLQNVKQGARQRSGSSGALLNIPAGAGPKRFSAPDIAQLAGQISRAEMSKLQRLGGDGIDNRSPPREPRIVGSHRSLNSLGMDQQLRGSRQSVNASHYSLPLGFEVNGNRSFEGTPPSSPPHANFARKNSYASLGSGFEMAIDQISRSPPSRRSRENSPQGDILRNSDSHRSSPSLSCFEDTSLYSAGKGLSRGKGYSELYMPKALHVIPSTSELQNAKLLLRPLGKGRPVSPGGERSLEKSGSNSKTDRLNSFAPEGPAVGSAFRTPSLPPPLQGRMQYSEPDVVNSEVDFETGRTSSGSYRRRLTAGDLTETIPRQSHLFSNAFLVDDAKDSVSRRSFRSDASGVYASIPQPPPAPPPPPPTTGERSMNRSPSLRRVALESRNMAYSNNGRNSSTLTRHHKTNSLPCISITEPQSPDSDYPQNNLSPTSTTPSSDSHGIYGSIPNKRTEGSRKDIINKSVSNPSTTYNVSCKGSNKLDDSRSTNADSALEEGEVKEDTDTWRPYDAFQVSEREAEEDGQVFRQILKVLRLILYFFITCVILTGTVASRISLLLLTSGLGQEQETRGEYVVMLLFCICTPIVLSWFSSFVKILFSGKQWPSFVTFLFLLAVELLQTFGVCLLLFKVLPVTDFFRGITITMATFQFPALFKLVLMERKLSLKLWDGVKLFAALLAFGAQVAAIVFFLITSFSGNGVHDTIPRGKQPQDVPKLPDLMWELPLALTLISLGWWENYLSGEWSLFGKVTLSFKRARKVVQDVRDTANFLVAPFKLGLAILLGKYLAGTTFYLPEKGGQNLADSAAFHMEHYGLLYLQILASILVTYLASLACKLHMQKTSFALPLLLSPPASLAVVYLQCRYEFLPGDWHIGLWLCPSMALEELVLPLSCAGALWISYCLVVSHVWFPRSERMAKIEKLFITPHLDAIFPDFHLTLRRRRNDRELRATHLEQFTYVGEENPYTLDEDATQDDVTPKVYVCATMWHETRREMTQLLKSLFRLDYVHCASKLAQDKFQIKDPDYYDLEIHIMFDDSFELDDTADKYVPNIFVRQLIESMEEAARSVVKGPIDIPPPVKTATPYGGLLVWTMPGQTKLHVHLKDKNLIRHRKRWSQCMYLYYLLGYRLLGGKEDTMSDSVSEGKPDNKHENLRQRGDKVKGKVKSKRRKMAAMPLRSLLGHMPPDRYEQTVQMSENTFILTLDGDVDFRPDSVRLLLDRMRKNKKVGAVCGRIHPIGSGPMVWYQQFEYAVGHWLQKASEHVFGCVLCCPGCFSLFRGSALMDDNVMKKYTTKPTEATHFIQFEQGEDRWLCTLLLQQGHRIDYSAGADALTFAPETFNEFFNQRRRWSPSTLANMMDLLSTWRETVRINDNVSRLYILYQFLLMASSILAPSTVILMITGSYHSVLGLSILWSFLLSLAPVIFYLIICLTQKNDVQIKVGAVLTALYTVVMMIATVGTFISIATESFSSPNVVFLTGLFIIFFVASLLHPQEFFCLVYGALYFLVVPSTFILLTVYYLCNLNNVSWGTREIPKKLTPDEEAAQKVAEEEKAKKKKKSLFSLYGIVSLVHELRDAVRGLWGLRDELNKQNNARTHQDKGHGDPEKGLGQQEQRSLEKQPLMPPKYNHPHGYEPNPEKPYWLKLDYLGYGIVETLSEEEKEFWRFLIKKYLHPLDEDKEQKAKIAQDLAIIRNNVVFIYVMMNFLWCVIALQLQAMESSLKAFYIVEKYEPLSLVFLAVFALVLILQFLSMLVHRWGTFLHLMASTRIDWFKKSHSEEEFARYVVTQTKKLQNLEPLPDYEEEDEEISSEEDGMSLSDFDPSLHQNGKNHGVDNNEQEEGVYETLRHPRQFQYPHQIRLQRTTSTKGQFPLLKTIFEQNLTNLQQRYQQKERGSVSAQQGQGTVRRQGADRNWDMRQRFFNHNFHTPLPHRNGRLFRAENDDIV